MTKILEYLWLLTICLTLVLAGCGDEHTHDHTDEGDHTHAEEHAHGDDHSHDDNGGSDAWAFTAWGERFEIFAEVDPLVVGETASAHTHVTVLLDFSPLSRGKTVAILRSPGGSEQVFDEGELVRDGIFSIPITPTTAGALELFFEVSVGAVTERISAGRLRPGSGEKDGETGGELLAARELEPAPRGEPVSFLKEQQWQVPFATAPASRGELQRAVGGYAKVRPRSGGEVLLTAPLDAVLKHRPWPHEGMEVAEGEVLLSLVPRLAQERSLAELGAQVSELEETSGATRKRVERLEELAGLGATSDRELEEARSKHAGLEARLEAARGDLEAARAARMGEAAEGQEVVLRSPFAGRVAAIEATPGEAVAAGARLARVVAIDPLWVEVALQPAEAARLGEGAAGLWLDLGGGLEPLGFEGDQVSLVGRSPEVDPETGRVAVFFELRGAAGQLQIGAVAEADVLLAEAETGIVLPATALVDDGGQRVVYLQATGEEFVRREVVVLIRRGPRVLVEGVEAGERVVIEGGETIRRASLTSGGGDAHGHMH